jgi:hypothetical protein
MDSQMDSLGETMRPIRTTISNTSQPFRVTRINERRCPRCGKGELSGYVYPSCGEASAAPTPHDLLCHGPWTEELCSSCEPPSISADCRCVYMDGVRHPNPNCPEHPRLVVEVPKGFGTRWSDSA